VSYQSQSQLEADPDFRSRARAAAILQATSSQDAIADAILRDEGGPINAITRLDAAGPGIADKVDNGDGTIDQAKVTDADLLSLTQANWPTVAGLYPPEASS